MFLEIVAKTLCILGVVVGIYLIGYGHALESIDGQMLQLERTRNRLLQEHLTVMKKREECFVDIILDRDDEIEFLYEKRPLEDLEN